MSDEVPENPLDPSPAFEQRVRERAYHLWLRDGRPEGREDEYWERAWELQSLAESKGAALKPNPMTDPEADHSIEEAVIQDNLGEFPDRVTDQGERRVVPMTRNAAQADARERGGQDQT